MRLLIGLAATLIILVCGASASAASFTCSASAARAVVLGQAIEPVKTVNGLTACATETKSLAPDAGLPSLLSGTALGAATQVLPAQKQVVASGGVTALKVLSLPGLPVTLPTAAVSDAARSAIAAARSVSVPLTGVKTLIPELPIVPDLPMLPVDLPDTLAEVQAAFPALSVLDATALATVNAGLNVTNAAANVTRTATNLANAPTNAANAVSNALRESIPDSASVNGAAGLDALLAALLPAAPQLPSTSLLEASTLMAHAAGACQDGRPSVSGSSTITGLKVLGEAVPGTGEVDRTLTLLGAASIDPSDVALPAIDLPLNADQLALINSIPAAKALLESAVETARTTVRSALDALSAVPVRDPTLARVVIRPGVQTKVGNSVVQEGLRVVVAIAGQTIVQGVLGEARVSAESVDCSKALTDAGTITDGAPLGRGTVTIPGFEAPVDTSTPEGALLACGSRRLVLVDVLDRNGRVRLSGVADPGLAGEVVSIVFGATGRVVARARIGEDGGFATTAPLPPARIRESNAARYAAVLDGERSSNLKLHRRMVVDSMRADGRRVTIAGRVLPPFGQRPEPVTLVRRVSCTKEVVEKRFRPDADGRFRITVLAPRNLGAAVYRMTTHVRFSEMGSGTFKTYTLPRAVDLG